MTTREELQDRFQFHPADTEQKRLDHAVVRLYAHKFAEFLNDLPEGREKSLALTKVEEAMFWSNAAIARTK